MADCNLAEEEEPNQEQVDGGGGAGEFNLVGKLTKAWSNTTIISLFSRNASSVTFRAFHFFTLTSQVKSQKIHLLDSTFIYLILRI